MKNIINQIRLSVSCADLAELGSEWNTENFDLFQRCIPLTRIYMPLDGTGHIHCEGHDFLLQRGKIILIPPFMPAFVSCDKYLVKYWTHFNAFWEESDSDLFSFLPGIIEYPLQKEDIVYFSSLFERLRQSFQAYKTPSISRLDETCAVSALILILEPFFKKISSEGAIHQIARIHELAKYMNSHLSDNFSLQQLAAKVNLNPCYLAFLFRKTMGISPIAYFSKLRIWKAIDELRRNDLRINEIAESIGIHDPSVFCRFFKRYTGMSPTEYRLASAKKKSQI